jgi:hypothetical protein
MLARELGMSRTTPAESKPAPASRVMELAPGLTEEGAWELLELARRHRVRWEVWPEREVSHGDVKQIGFEIDLIGEHFQVHHQPSPGCDECQIVYRALRKIADYAVPKAERASRYPMDRFDGTMPYDRAGEGTGFVTLTIRILHRTGYHDPPDDCERLCLAEIEQKLSVIGARPGARHLGAS